MTNQLSNAIVNALGSAGDPNGAPVAGGKMPGGRILAAMFKANAGACSCETCVLLKQEVAALFETFLAQGEAPAATSQPPAAAAPLSGPIETVAGG